MGSNSSCPGRAHRARRFTGPVRPKNSINTPENDFSVQKMWTPFQKTCNNIRRKKCGEMPEQMNRAFSNFGAFRENGGEHEAKKIPDRTFKR
jgi:hypothetical protein